MKKFLINRLASRSWRLLLAGFALVTTANAQPAEKSIVAEPVAAFAAFNQWVSTLVVAPREVRAGTVEYVSWRAEPLAETAYQPLPVILGLPELPLWRSDRAQAPRHWSPSFNYQGLYLQQLVLNAPGTLHQLRPISTPLRSGERFKLRVTPTFDAVAQVEQVTGDAWYGQRQGQVYPQAGSSVRIKAGESVDLPLEPNGYFQMNRSAQERLLIAVRDPRAIGLTRSDQPAYRQDAGTGSSYLQLVAPGKFAAMEQLISQDR
jgi:hypothetical protein